MTNFSREGNDVTIHYNSNKNGRKEENTDTESHGGNDDSNDKDNSGVEKQEYLVMPLVLRVPHI